MQGFTLMPATVTLTAENGSLAFFVESKWNCEAVLQCGGAAYPLGEEMFTVLAERFTAALEDRLDTPCVLIGGAAYQFFVTFFRDHCSGYARRSDVGVRLAFTRDARNLDVIHELVLTPSQQAEWLQTFEAAVAKARKDD